MQHGQHAGSMAILPIEMFLQPVFGCSALLLLMMRCWVTLLVLFPSSWSFCGESRAGQVRWNWVCNISQQGSWDMGGGSEHCTMAMCDFTAARRVLPGGSVLGKEIQGYYRAACLFPGESHGEEQCPEPGGGAQPELFLWYVS